jgi:multisubunit Na+/H+ antiporter MnhB subunit
MSATKKFNLGEAIVPGLALIFAIAYFVQTSDAPLIAMKWPYMIALLVAFFWVAVVVFFIFKKNENEENAKSLSVDKKQIVIFAVPVLYIFAMNYLGFAIASLIFLTSLFRILGSTNWVKNIIIAFVITGVLFTALVVLMQMSFPEMGITIGSITI